MNQKSIGCLMIVLVCILSTAFSPMALADDPAARRIMEKVDARNDGNSQVFDMEMVLIDKWDNKRIRKIRGFRKDKGEDILKLMFFEHPADVKDTGFLTYDYGGVEKDDDQWLYLPALRKTKRIATVDRSGSFMGSDLNYSDMMSFELQNYDYRFYEKGKEAEVRGKKVWVIWSVPRKKDVVKETGYKKSLLFVRPDIDMTVRSIRWTDTGGYLKYVDVKSLEQIDGIWVATETHITKKRGKTTEHKTILTLDNVKFNQDIDDDLFTIRRMEKGL